MRRRGAFAGACAAVAVAAGLAGCASEEAPDLFVVQRSGTIPGARLTLRISDDGGAFCNGGPRREITSAQLIEARDLRRQLDGDSKTKGLAKQGLHLPPGRVTTLSYRVRSEQGVVSFSDTSAHQPLAFYRLAKLTRDVARGACKLAR